MSAAAERNRAVALSKLFEPRALTLPSGITSVCSAHPLVIEAAFRRAVRDDQVVLLEATCNQVNQEGGYTGMTPGDFRHFVERIAGTVGLSTDRIILGGDHLGPNPWRKLPAQEAMSRAEAMIVAYVEAGFEKLHLDTSMGCAGEPSALPDALTAERAASLARVAEEAARRAGRKPPVYIIGTEVPPPGGATHALEELEVTAPDAVLETLRVHHAAFTAAGIAPALERVIGVVVQPGVEFGNANVMLYKPARAEALIAALDAMPGVVFEAHSTDYQSAEELSALVDGGFAIMKVGPGLTFALREALYGLDTIRKVIADDAASLGLPEVLEDVMLADQDHWSGHYGGDAQEQRLQRHFSYSDRIRYYWPDKRVQAAVEQLFAALSTPIPETLISQYLSRLYPDVVGGRVAPTPRELCLAAIDHALSPYRAATTRQSA
ncbi:D-tagatose-bisphosphate aldolase, class II, non-catalytic subunit [Agrobacterium sp. S2]|nr:D-tagatose-bisphosphate aldolase, class II, non-catalytic subunit [Agrobacterium sp. S2]